MRHPPPTMRSAIVTRPVTFDVGEHKLVVTNVLEGRWTAAVDGHLLDASFETQADAWQAGVREAYASTNFSGSEGVGRVDPGPADRVGSNGGLSESNWEEGRA